MLSRASPLWWQGGVIASVHLLEIKDFTKGLAKVSKHIFSLLGLVRFLL